MLALCLAAAAGGVASHVLYFNRGEHHLWAVRYIQLFSVACLSAIVGLVNFYDYRALLAIAATTTVAASFLVGVWTSLIIYRAFLSPLCKFPGPFLARISSLWLTFTVAPKLNGYHTFQALHEKYGAYVRIGPDTLSVSDADLHEQAFGHNTKFRKAIWYDGNKPYDSIHTTRDKALHDRRRRMWVPAFSDKALREYEPKVRAHNLELLEQIHHREGLPMNMSLWFNLYSFDVMGQLAFGKEYGMVRAGKRHWALDLLSEGMKTAGFKIPVWLFRVIAAIPGLAAGMHKFLRFSQEEMQWRVDNLNAEGDITGWLLKAYKDIENPAKDPMLNADCRLIIVAGSDTTAACMTFLFYELAKKPEELKKLRDELKPLAKADWSDIDIRNAQHLNGAINESLRLHPPVPSGVDREVPEQGVTLKNGVYLPGQTIVQQPQYVISRREDYYTRAADFVPERWYSKPDMVKHKNAFAPFSLGSENCIGKNLAMIEMRTLAAELILRYDVALAPGEDGHALLQDTADHFTLGLAKMDLVFTPVAS